jgi:hypothetical protein
LNDRVVIRQVPGDGNCLFHSITVALACVINGTHIDMTGVRTRTAAAQQQQQQQQRHNRHSTRFRSKPSFSSRRSRSSSSNSKKYHDDYLHHRHLKNDQQQQHQSSSSSSKHPHDLQHLYQHSQHLREKAVEVLAKNPRRLLFLQGNEYLRAKDLVNAAAAQYDMTGERYCELMKRESYWGGGPEIVALCNYLKRPIHVYELSDGEYDEDDVNEHVDSHVDENSHADDGQEGKRGEDEGQDWDVANLPQNEEGSERMEQSTTTSTTNNNPPPPRFRLRRMACFGSPKFDRKEPINILSADSRFPDVRPGQQLPSGNHFMACFPEDFINDMIETDRKAKKKMKRRRKSAGVRGGAGAGPGGIVHSDDADADADDCETDCYDGSNSLASSSSSVIRQQQRQRQQRGYRHRHEHQNDIVHKSLQRIENGMDIAMWPRGIFRVCQIFMEWLFFSTRTSAS